MKKFFDYPSITAILAAFIGILMMATSCSKLSTEATTTVLTKETFASTQNEGFAIYLTKDDISPDKMPALNQSELADKPIIALNDVVTYNLTLHELTINDDASGRISNLVVPTNGKSFVVCVDRKPIYWGVLWPEYSSAIPPSSIVIVSFPLSHTVQIGDAEGLQINPNILQLSYYGTDDPRGDTVIIDSLRQAGKLINEGFAIYLTKGDIPPSQMEALSHVDIVDKPVIGLNDIVTYNSTNHEITLTENGINNITGLRVLTSGKSFVVCVNQNPVYWGAFWTPISSQSFNGITIEIPLLSGQEVKTISINLGYPSQSFHHGEDPRNNTTVMESLKQSGKLITTPDNPLPRSFKGYELYSWQQDNLWNYTLITGTNRDKTVQEIITGNNTVSADGWVNIHVVGEEQLEALISRIPANEYVIWLSGPRADLSQSIVNFELPPTATIDDFKALAAQCGLNFTVLAP